MKRAVRDSLTQIGNHSSKSDASIQKRDSIECWRNGEFSDGSIGCETSKGDTKMYDTFGYKNKFARKTSVSRRRRIARMSEQSQSLARVQSQHGPEKASALSLSSSRVIELLLGSKSCSPSRANSQLSRNFVLLVALVLLLLCSCFAHCFALALLLLCSCFALALLLLCSLLS